MKEKPILMNEFSVQGILKGIKTHTRRVIKKELYDCPCGNIGYYYGSNTRYEDSIQMQCEECYTKENSIFRMLMNPKYEKDQILWVRETWMPFTENGIKTGAYIYKASDRPEPDGDRLLKWKPSIYMPREAARIFLKVKNIKIERIQDISAEDCWKEGISEDCYNEAEHYMIAGIHLQGGSPERNAFINLWNSINAKPKPVYRNKKIEYYVSYPWSKETADDRKMIKGKPHYCYPNSFVWIIEFERIENENISK